MSKIAKRSAKAASPKRELCETVCEPVNPAAMESTPTVSTKEVFDASFWPRRRLTLSSFNGRTLIHIREYVLMGDKEYHTKKGVCFTPGRLSVLRGKIDLIDAMLILNADPILKTGEPTYREHLGAGIYASISEEYQGVSLRRYWIPEGQHTIAPTKNGIYLPVKQWSALKLKLDELLAAHPGLIDAVECINTHGGNQMEIADCRECMPFGWLSDRIE